MRMKTTVAMLAALVLVVAACGAEPDSDTASDPAAGSAEDGGPDPNDGSVLPGDEPGEVADEGVAAVVNGQEISAEEVDQQVQAFSATPDVAEALEGPDGEQTLAALRAQVVSNLIINRLAVEGAEALGAPVTEDDVTEARSELEEETGGAEALQAALDAEGMSEEQLVAQLRALAALRNIEVALAEDAGDTAGDPADDAADDEAGTAAQRFISDLVRQAQVVVATDYGSWDPQTGQVAPAGAFPQEGLQPAP